MIYGFIISILTFPGVIFHELSHKIFCHICKIPVHEVKYFQFQNPCGYVIHQSTDSPLANVCITMGPFSFNSLVGILIGLPVQIKLFNAKAENINCFYWILYYLSFSVLMHAFPSFGDGKALYDSVIKNNKVHIFSKILVFPLVGLIHIGSAGSFFWLDAIYALTILRWVSKLLIIYCM